MPEGSFFSRSSPTLVISCLFDTCHSILSNFFQDSVLLISVISILPFVFQMQCFALQQSEILHFLKKRYVKIMVNMPIFDKIGLEVHGLFIILDIFLYPWFLKNRLNFFKAAKQKKVQQVPI